MNGRFLDGPRAGSMLQSASGGTTPPPGYVGLEVCTLPLSSLVRACFPSNGAGSGREPEPVLGRLDRDVRVRARALGGDLDVRRG